MLFNSFAFLVFFPLVTGLYFILVHQHRWVLLLLASCIFYMWFIPQYMIVLIVLIFIDYWAGLLIENSPKEARKKYLIFSICATCLTLFIFKYFNFFSFSFSQIANLFGFHYPPKILELILPIGLSFHTFQSLSYVIEVYNGHQKAERHLGIYALYVMFYPQLVAGPIERPQNLIHQLREKHFFEYQRVVDGLKLMAWGMFKKVVIADRLAIFVNLVYGDPLSYPNNGPAFVLATIFFAFQIYCDFSGYSDIAIGAAQVMGFKLTSNFNRPYFAQSISEFWNRWHISLSSWFRDYIYIPLGGNRCGKIRWLLNILVTFLICGLWHGANWTYVIWGALHGFYLVFGVLIKDFIFRINNVLSFKKHERAQNLIKILITFLLICFSWIFFRAKDIHDAFYIVGILPHGWLTFLEQFKLSWKNALWLQFGLSNKYFLLSTCCIVFLIFIEWIQRHGSIRHMLINKPSWFRWILYFGVILGMMFLGQYGHNQFIYFQF